MTHAMLAVTFGDVGRSFREAFFMFWETLWALVLGFGLSGVVQAFVSKAEMQRVLGDHRPTTVAKATGLGMVSSSCSYAASAMAKSLFQKGADFVSAMAFMFASTNLVIELGIVLVILMGWQFAAAEFVGGLLMITGLALLGGIVFKGPLVDAARRRLQADGPSDDSAEPEHTPWRHKLTSKAAWADAASYTMSDITMVRKELVIGYVVAGFLMVMVPITAWNDLFLQGHGTWTSIENVLLGPVIACVSFVCSVGNVPMAAALWHGGISFGGVISFIFADLLALPLIMIYRKYYGTRLSLRLVGLFYVVMVLAGLLVETIFKGAGAVPTLRHAHELTSHFRWNYTTFLDIAFLGVFAVLVWLARNQERLGGGRGYAIDPVCGMQVRTADAPARVAHEGRTHYFCCDHCAERFVRERATSPR